MWSLLLLADAREDPLQRPEVVWGVVGLAGALLVGAAVIYAVDKWRKRAAAGASTEDSLGALTSFRAMYESGEITEAEYAELRRRVADKVRKPADPSPAKPGFPTAPFATPAQSGQPPAADPPAPPGGAPEPPPPPSTA